MSDIRKMTLDEWNAEGKRRFGEDKMDWKFKCPSCGHIASARSWKEAGAKPSDVGFNCIGRFQGDPKETADAAFKKKGGPCNYTSGGLFKLNTLVVDSGDHAQQIFEFA